MSLTWVWSGAAWVPDLDHLAKMDCIVVYSSPPLYISGRSMVLYQVAKLPLIITHLSQLYWDKNDVQASSGG